VLYPNLAVTADLVMLKLTEFGWRFAMSVDRGVVLKQQLVDLDPRGAAGCGTGRTADVGVAHCG
jgi:hypothetical protein